MLLPDVSEIFDSIDIAIAQAKIDHGSSGGKKPYRCPICDGEGKVSKNSAFVGYEGDKCKACKGKCVLWG